MSGNARLSRSICAWVALAPVVLSGCQGWSNGALAMPAGSRVPSPATGSYPMPQNYYRSGGQVSQNVSPTTNVGVRPVNGALPATNLTAGGVAPGAVQPAGFVPAGAANPNLVTPSYATSPVTQPATGPGSGLQPVPTVGSAADSGGTPAPLNWQH